MSIIELKDVNFIYGKKTPYEMHALKDINLTIEQGSVTGIIGHTGSGKSTLIQLLNGLEKPESGKVIVKDKDIWEKPKEISKIRHVVGMVMQYPEYQLFADTVREDIAFGPKNLGVPDDEINKRVDEAAKFCGIDTETLNKSPFDLSGGQKRRVALAGVMAMDPEILVLDEPAAGLDPRGRREILGGITEYKEKSQKTIIIVSHSMEDMARYSDDVIVLSGARILRQGTREEVFAHVEELAETGLDVPQITHLMRLLRQRGINAPKNIYTVEEATAALKQLFVVGGDVG